MTSIEQALFRNTAAHCVAAFELAGFDSEPLGGGRWRYCLHTDAVEYCFEAGWPAIEKAG